MRDMDFYFCFKEKGVQCWKEQGWVAAIAVSLPSSRALQ